MITLITVYTLQSLELCCIGITTVDDEAFQCLHFLNVLRLNSNHLTVGPSLQHIRNIKHLYLYKNRITNLPRDYFAGCLDLAVMNFANNHLVSLPDMAHVTPSLQFVVLTENRLMFLDALESMPWPQLRSLSLSGNSITGLEISLLDNAKVLRLIDLRHNELRTLPDLTQFKMFQNTSHMLAMRLEENPWHCNESLQWVLEGTKNNDYLDFDEGFKIDGLLCHTPSKLKSMLIWDLGKFILPLKCSQLALSSCSVQFKCLTVYCVIIYNSCSDDVFSSPL